MGLFSRRVTNAPGGKDRRKPTKENAEIRKHFEQEKKKQAHQNLATAQQLTAQVDERIERLRRIARVISKGSA